MINKNNTPLRKLVKYLKVFSIAIFLITANNLYAQNNDSIKKADKCNEVFDIVEKQPEFPGGIEAFYKFLAESFIFTKETEDLEIEGQVITNFIVHKDGSTSDIKILKGVDSLLDTEAIRVLSLMPKWEPGKLSGQPVNVRFTLPVSFRLRKDEEMDNREIEDEEEGKCNPEYLKYLGENVRYPIKALKNKISGVIKATYDVSSEGKISNIQITEGKDKSLKREVVKLVDKIPTHLALARTGGKEAKDVELSVIFRMGNQRDIDDSSKDPDNCDLVVVAY